MSEIRKLEEHQCLSALTLEWLAGWLNGHTMLHVVESALTSELDTNISSKESSRNGVKALLSRTFYVNLSTLKGVHLPFLTSYLAISLVCEIQYYFQQAVLSSSF